jgi:ribosomal protein S18 acetylase RimI-like enzyme
MSATENKADINFRMGQEGDALSIAELYNMANNGLSEVWWAKQARKGESWKDAFVRDIKMQNSIAHFARSVIAEANGKVIGLLIAFPQEEIPPAELLAGLPSSELSIIELRRRVEGSLFIAVVAVDENYRNRGIARHFVNMSLHVAQASNLKEVSVIIHESNREWLESFLRRGFKERARENVGDHASYPHDSSWVLVAMPVLLQASTKSAV